MMLAVTEEYMEVRDPLKKDDAMASMRGHLIEGDMRMEFTLGEGMQIEVENPQVIEDLQMMDDPLMMEDPLMTEGPQVMEAPLIMEDPQEMEGIPDTLEDKDPLVPQDLLDQ